MMGFRGRSGDLIDQLLFRCAPLEVTWDGNDYNVSRGTPFDISAVGGSGGDPFGQADCPGDQVATVANIRAGDSIDAFGLGCQAPSLYIE